MKSAERGTSRNNAASCRLAPSVDNCSHLKSSLGDSDMPARSESTSAKPDPHQLSIFDLESAANDRSELAPVPEVDLAERGAGRRVKAPARATKPITVSPVRVVAIGDLPRYPKELIEQVDGSITSLPSEKLWFTYQDIRRCFGVSRATIARRLKEGLVPGVRFQEGRMLEDGAVRRLDREQLRWLLLAVQRGRDRMHYA
jgi:hypothetical protein